VTTDVGGNTPGGLLLLLTGVMLLLMFVTGRLEWLFSLARDVNDARTDGFQGGQVTPAGVQHPAIQRTTTQAMA